MSRAMSRSSTPEARVAALAAAVSAGAAAISLSRSRKATSDVPAAPAAGDSALVGLIERVAEATDRATRVDDVLRACVDQLCRWTGWPVGHVYVADPHRRERLLSSSLWYLGDVTRYAGFRTETERMPMVRGVGLPGRVLESGRAEWIVDLSCDANFPRNAVAAEAGLRGAFSFPISSAGEIVAVIECFSTRTVAPDDRLLEVASHIGRQVGRRIAGMRSAKALRASEDRFTSFRESTSDAIITADSSGLIVSWNSAAERMFGTDRREMVGKPLSVLMPERFRAAHDAGLRRVSANRADARIMGRTVEVVGMRADGSEFPIELSLSCWDEDEGRFFGGIIRDISDRVRAEEQARVLETAPDPIVEVDASGNIVLANARTEQLFGYGRSELVGRPVQELFAASSRELPLAPGVELTGRRKDGHEFPLEVTFGAVTDDEDAVATCILRDVTERRRFEAQLRHQADHDHITRLFNRRRFEEELAAYAQRRDQHGAMLLLDLDRFKYINDVHGHTAGDAMVRTIAGALHTVLGDDAVVARLGGDEFAILLDGADRDAAERTAVAVVSAVREQRITLGTIAVSITASVGVVPFRTNDTAPESVLAAADLAMYAAKEAGGDGYHVTDRNDDRVAGMQARLDWADQVRRALDEDRFVLYWQPIVELASGHATHYELLLRMVSSDGKIIPPGAFIEPAEHFGLIGELDRWVVKNAIHALADGRVADGLRIEVNLSGRSIGDPELPELIEREIALTGIDPARLVFEITETAAITNMRDAQTFAERLKQLGCRFALDDFGAGFASFYYLKHLPLDYLKIDGDFVKGLTTSDTDQVVVKAMVDIARGLGLKTIAEFVEDAETVARLREHGVDHAQGYHYGRPEPMPRAAASAPPSLTVS
ncbi:PAS domain S-box-containing protein/diguanylate cyclase (GGDEF)-like protein [Solirubrobacter pauli]|uniref:PAS domain S-box-containing protein/diguanylate cyclase (GGDEF)-like protein n=1 Tax=Solirubrobacter pauli TaxID=166793 RepID=A0A660KZG0_9ACTN|nr:PAS domain S-box-containing protein/diguanylate cyclase (GGDEF)-like protein [Solirubrobacter pauli]